MAAFLLGIDIGTSACKVTLFCSDGSILANSHRNYPSYYPHFGWVEQNPEEWWEAVCLCIQTVLKSSNIAPKEIAGVAVAGQSWSIIPVDRDGRCLTRTPIWMDVRALDICERLDIRTKEEIFRISGNCFRPSYTTPKLLWMKKELPHIYRQTNKFLQSNSFIVMKLTGVLSQDVSQGYGLHIFDNEKLCYDEHLAETLEIDLNKIPDIYPCHEIVGTVTSIASSECGLSIGTPVVAGGLDAACSTLGAGVYIPGQVQEQGGQAGGMSICTDWATSHPALISSAHVVPGKWLLQGGTVGGSGVMRWLHEKLWSDDSFVDMDALASTVTPGSNGVIFLPYMAGERSPIWDPNAVGVYYGLGFNKTKGHLIRAALEGVAFSLEHNLRIARSSGVTVERLSSVGGASNSNIWTQIKADVTGCPIDVSASDTATTLGAAILAGIATGVYSDFAEAVGQTVKVSKSFLPNQENHCIYQHGMSRYLMLYESLKDVFASK